MNKKRAITGFLLSLVFLSVFSYIIFSAQRFLKNPYQGEDFLGSISDATQNTNLQNIIGNTDENTAQPTILKPEINAEAVISVESNLLDLNKTIFEKASNLRLPIASLTKLMTAVIVLDNYDLSKKIIVSELADSQDPMKQDIKLGDIMPIESFFEIMLIGSSNKSAYALSEVMGVAKFVGLMNEKAKEMGLENTFFDDPTGLSPKNISTASDLAKLAEHILKNYTKIAEISRSKELDVPGFGKVVNTDQLLGEIPEVVCGKTGFTTQAKGCLLLVVNNKKNNGYLINVILGADDRFSEMKKLINWSNEICK